MLRCVGEPEVVADGEATGLAWFSPDDAAGAERFGFGQGDVVAPDAGDDRPDLSRGGGCSAPRGPALELADDGAQLVERLAAALAEVGPARLERRRQRAVVPERALRRPAKRGQTSSPWRRRSLRIERALWSLSATETRSSSGALAGIDAM